MKGRKKPSPSPTTPPIPYVFIVIIRTPFKTLVESSSSSILVASYVAVIVVAYAYLPWAGMVYVVATVVYFYPVFVHLDVWNVIVKFVRRMREPYMEQWRYSRTKRRRDRMRGRVGESGEESDSDDYEEFIASLSGRECYRILEEEVWRRSSSSDNDEFGFSDDFEFEHSSSDDSSYSF